jgi:hypothetical protein
MGRPFKTVQCHNDLVAIGKEIARHNNAAALKLLDAIDAKLPHAGSLTLLKGDL